MAAEQEYRLPTDREWSAAVGLKEEEDQKVRERDDLTKIRFKYPWGDWPKNQPLPEGVGNIGGLEADDGHLPKTFTPTDGYRDRFPRTAPVGSFHQNPLGIFDLDGNVCEWCEDEDDLKPGYRLARGAYWMSFGRRYLLSAYRRSERPGRRNSFYGFRCVLGPVAP